MMDRRGISAVVAFLLTAGRAVAANGQWTAIGPPGGTVRSLAFDGSVANQAYAATSAGFFRSTDGGSSWNASNDGLRDADLEVIATTGATIYVGGADGVSKSDDRGLRFRHLVSSPRNVIALALGAGTSSPLFAAGDFDSGAWRSDDGGTTWEEIDEGLVIEPSGLRPAVHAFLVHPRRAGLLWAGSGNGVYRSLDGGAHWVRTSAGLTCAVTSLAMDDKGKLYAGCYVDLASSSPPPALFISFDLGSTWHAAVRGLAGRGVTALLADPAGAVWAGTEDAGVFRSDNGGRTWRPAGSGIEGQTIGALAQAPRQPALLLAGSGQFIAGPPAREGASIFRTTSSGARWAMAAAGPASRSIDAVVADPVKAGLLTAADRSVGVFLSRSAGAHWRLLDAGLAPANAGLGPAPAITQIVADAELSGELYALGLVFQAPDYAPVLYRHGPDPATPWRQLTSVPEHCFGPLTAGAQGQLFLGGFTDQGRSVCVSDDAGATWKIVNVELLTISMAVAPSNRSRVYASGEHVPSGPTFYRSDDAGASWTAVGAILTSEAHGLAVDPLDQDLVYAGTAGGVRRSRDGGVTWETLLPEAAALVRVDPRTPSTIYAAPGPSTVVRPPSGVPLVSVSDDGGATWSPLAAGLPPNVPVVDLAFDAADPALLYAATAGGGVFSLHRVH